MIVHLIVEGNSVDWEYHIQMFLLSALVLLKYDAYEYLILMKS